jgi:hypothetical protein
MRQFIIFAFLLLAIGQVDGNPIKLHKAQVKAASFVGKQINRQPRMKMVYAPGGNAEEAPLYVFNVGDKKGFVIVAGEEDGEDVIGYADEGEFDYDNMPDNLKAWVDTYAARAAAKAPTKAKRTQHPTEVVEPLITTKWGQRVPFNRACPKVDGEPCPTGCTATAMAQVMRYHRFPIEQSTAIPKYTTQTLKLVMPQLPATTFNWDDMPDELDEETSPQSSIDEVAKLMLYCGQATDMNYTAEGSGAFTYKIPDRLPKYFGYPATMHYVYRQSYDEQGWDSLLVSELLKSRPVIYTAYTNVPLGHTFICDGYDGNGMFHINWGWYGVGNGYFRISEAYATDEGLNPNIKNYHLSLNQTALVGLMPSGEDDYVFPQESYVAFTRPSLKNGKTYTRESTTDGFVITMKQSFVNSSEETKRLAHGIGLYNEEGGLVTVATSSAASLSAGGKKDYEVKQIAIGGNIKSGHYTIKSVYKPTSTSPWRPMGGTERNYVDVVIDELNATLTPMPKADFVVGKVSKEKSFMLFDFSNYDEDFYGPVYLRRLNTANNTISQVSYDYMSVDSNTRRTFELYIDDSMGFDIDNDVFYLSVDEYDNQYFYCSKSTQENVLVEKKVEILNLDEDSTTIVGDRALCKLTVTNNNAEDTEVEMTVSLVDDMGRIVGTQQLCDNLEAGADTVVYHEIPLTDYERKYMVVVSHRKNEYTIDESTTSLYNVAQGAFYWTKDGSMKTMLAAKNLKVPEEALAIHLRGAYSSNVTANSNPNTIYMLDKTLPKGLVGKNYVNNSNMAATMVFTDGFDYFIPQEFVFASAIKYTREIPMDSTATFSTICLPFSPTKVTADGVEVKWKESEDDTSGVFRIMCIDSITADTTKLSCVSKMEAYKTYLIVTDSLLAGATLEFSCAKDTLRPTLQQDYVTIVDEKFAWMGVHGESQPDNCFVVSDNHLVFKETGNEVTAFRGYLTTTGEVEYTSIALGTKTSTDEEQYPVGDVNGDGAVDVSDVMLIVAMALGETVQDSFVPRADINGDGVVDVTDVMTVVQMILTH